MRILVTGAKGMVGTALVNNLKNIKDGKNKTRPNIKIDEIFEYDLGDESKLGMSNSPPMRVMRLASSIL